MSLPIKLLLQFSLVCLFAFSAGLVWAQEDAEKQAANDPGLMAMQKLASMVGSWEGTGWMRQGPAEPDKTISTESVEFALDGRIMVIKGLHFSNEDPTQVVHNAYAVVSHDNETGNYRFQTWLADGRTGNYELKIEGESILWFMESPQGKIRYTIDIKDDSWTEVGEFSSDGQQWSQFFQMDLNKK